MERKFLSKGTVIFTILLLVTAFIFAFIIPRQRGNVCEIWIDGALFRSYDISVPFEIALENGVEIAGDGESVFFSSSDCPDKVCVNTGKLHFSGEWAACLPNKTVIKIFGRSGDTDVVA